MAFMLSYVMLLAAVLKLTEDFSRLRTFLVRFDFDYCAE